MRIKHLLYAIVSTIIGCSLIIIIHLKLYVLPHLNITYVMNNDYHQLIDIKEFKFNLINQQCDTSTILLVTIHSSPANVQRRKVIKKSWGEKREGLVLVFVIADVTDAKLEKQIEQENNEFKDFIKGNFIDTYRNLKYKLVSALKYALHHCPDVKYLLKTDDDVFVNIQALMEETRQNTSVILSRNLILGNVIRNHPVLRDEKSKWNVDPSEYPEEIYPDYVSGYVILYSMDVVKTTYFEAQRSKYFWIDDVHITGTIRKKLGLTTLSMKYFTLIQREIDPIMKEGVVHRPFIFCYFHLPENQIRALWEFIGNNKYDQLRYVLRVFIMETKYMHM